MNFSFIDKIVMITGATGGLGLSLAKAFAKAGAKLSLIGRQEGMNELFASVLPLNTEYLVLKADLSQDKEIDSVVNNTVERFLRIDVLINCAGMNIRKKLADYSTEDWDNILNVNLRSIFFLSKNVSSIMKNNKYGKIVNISSIQSAICWTGNHKYSPAPYCASKAGLDSLTRSFALDLAEYGINVNSICPAVIDGRWADSFKNDKSIYDDIISRTPLKRLCTHDDIVGPVMLFASDYGSFITGQCLMVDGGWTIE